MSQVTPTATLVRREAPMNPPAVRARVPGPSSLPAATPIARKLHRPVASSEGRETPSPKENPKCRSLNN